MVAHDAPGRRRTALVTGAARRIGRAIALALAEAGYAVAVHCNASRQDADEVVAQIVSRGGRAGVVIADLGDPEEVERLVPAAAAVVGPVTLLVNNAAEFLHDGIGSLRREIFDRQLAVNLRAPLFLAEALAAALPEDADDPSIVNLLDQRVLSPRPDYVSYQLSKAALQAATRILAQALAPRIRVNAVGPGPTFRNTMQTKEDFAAEERSTLLGHGSSAADVAAAVLYLAEARSVTGQMIAVDFGQHLVWRE